MLKEMEDGSAEDWQYNGEKVVQKEMRKKVMM
jgi:hypothetical protein